MTSSGDRTVLCVDPEGEMTAQLEAESGFTTEQADTVETATALIENSPVACVVAAYELPDGTAFDLFETARRQHPNVGCLVVSERDHDEIIDETAGETVVQYLPREALETETRIVETVRTIVNDRTQVGFPLPADEDDRLDTLAEYDLEGLDAVSTFDRLSELIASHFEVSVAFVGLVDETEERFLACHGADWDQLEREKTICTYAILDEEITVIENVQEDPRFEYNETLEELNIRSYAGANLTAPNGDVIGELCLIHDSPRSYTQQEQNELLLFADEVTEQLELRRRLGSADVSVDSALDERTDSQEEHS